MPRDTIRRKAICACDEITGLITAVALVRPSRSLYDLEASSVKKKWKDKAFAAGTSRAEMEHAAQEFGIELWEHVGNVIQAMRKIAPELGLVGNVPQPSSSRSHGSRTDKTFGNLPSCSLSKVISSVPNRKATAA